MVALTFSALLTTYCALLLLEIRKKVNATSYTMIGEKTLGNTGKQLVNIALVGSQLSFVCAYIFFIKNNFASFFNHYTGVDEKSAQLWFAMMCFVIFSLLCWVRKIEVFSATHIFANFMIVLTVIVIVYYGCQ